MFHNAIRVFHLIENTAFISQILFITRPIHNLHSNKNIKYINQCAQRVSGLNFIEEVNSKYI